MPRHTAHHLQIFTSACGCPTPTSVPCTHISRPHPPLGLPLPAAAELESIQTSWRASWEEYGKCTPAESAVAYLALGLQLDGRYPLVGTALHCSALARGCVPAAELRLLPLPPPLVLLLLLLLLLLSLHADRMP